MKIYERTTLDGTKVTNTYNDQGYLVSQKKQDGEWQNFQYDEENRLVYHENENYWQKLIYDKAGGKITWINSMGDTWDQEADEEDFGPLSSFIGNNYIGNFEFK